MKARLFSSRGIAFALLAMLILVLFAAPTFAATSNDHSQWSPCFAATLFQEIAGNRSKIIQMSIVFVLIGIALLFKK